MARGIVIQGKELTHYKPDPVAILTYENQDCQAWCYGELISYDNSKNFSQVIEDYCQTEINYQRLNGRFILYLWDKRHDEWIIITDRLGAMHCYIAEDADRNCIIGTDLATIALSYSKRQLDWDAIAGFFAHGFFLDNRTYYKDVQILAPASIYRISNHGQKIECHQYWQWNHRVNTKRTYQQTLDTYHILLKQAIQRCTNDTKYILPISGGLDSRSLAAFLPSGTTSYSYGYYDGSIETKIAAQIAKKQKFLFAPYTIKPYLFDRLSEITRELHGCQDITQARQCSVNSLVSQQADVILTGLWGDVWCDDLGYTENSSLNLTTFTRKKFQKYGSQWLLDNLSKPYMEHQLIERINKGLAHYSHIEDLDFRIKAYKTSQWAFRWSNASLRGFEIGAHPRIPYYDIDLVDFFCTVPTEFVRNRRLQIDHLKQYAPELASIRWQQAGVNLYLEKYRSYLTLPTRIYNKLYRTITNTKIAQRNWEIQFLADNGRSKLEQSLLQKNLPLHEFVDSSVVQTLINEFYTSPDRANGYTVSMLLTFSAWLEITQ